MLAIDYAVTGIGASLIPNPALRFVKVDDPLLGTETQGIPEGPFNTELYKLLQNTGALANLFQGYLQRTMGAANTTPMPDPVTAPQPMPGAPSTPGHGAYHTLYYQDYEVLFRYDALNITPGWYYVSHVPRYDSVIGAGVILARSSETVQVDLTTDMGNHTEITIPDGYTIAHLKTFYIVSGGDPESIPVISVLPCVFAGASTIRFTFSITPPDDISYTLMCIFEKFSTL